MNLNWNNEVTLDLITGSVLLLGGVLFIIKSQRNKVKPLLFFGLSWLFYSLFFYLEAVSYLFLSIEVAKIQASLIAPSVIFLVMYIDYTRRESFKVLNIGLVTGFSFILIYTIFFENNIVIREIDGQYFTVWTGNVLIVATLLQVLFTYFLMKWVVISAINNPNEIKYIRNLFITGITFLAFLGLFFFMISSTSRLFVIIADICMCIGAIITIYVFIHEPKIFYILPFTAYQLNVIHILSGLPLYEYKWTESKIRDGIISSSLHGLRNLSLNIMGTGEVLDLKLEHAVLLIQRTENASFGLLSTNSSKFLRDCLKNFTLRFEKVFKKHLKEELIDSSIFLKADEIIKQIFTNIPSRIIN